MEILRKTATGIEHGLLTTLVNHVSKAEAFKKLDTKRKEEIESRNKRNSALKKVRYINYRDQKRGYKCMDYSNGPGEPLHLFKFLHGQVYTIPLGLVELLNSKRTMRPVRADSLDENGLPRPKDEMERLEEFVPAEF